MKQTHNIIRTIVILLLAVVCTLPALAANKKQRTSKAVIKTHFNCDHCKKCETCGQKFEANLYKIKGIKSYEINEKNMTITVVYNPQKVNVAMIRKAISSLGFDADEIKADPVAYNQLDPCCKK